MEYDGWAERYDDDTARFGWCAPQVVLDAVSAVKAKTATVLDLGVGTGHCSLPLARVGAQVTGVDASDAMLTQAKKSGAYAELHHLAVGAKPLRTILGAARFDLAVSCGVLHFVPTLAELCAEVFDLLQPGGWFVFTTIPPQTRSFSDATHVRSQTEVQELLLRAGFSVDPPERFVAYYAQGDRSEPVFYELWRARRAPEEQA